MKKDDSFLEVAKTLETERSCEKMKTYIEVIRKREQKAYKEG